MKLICPKCGSGFEVDEAVKALEHREVRDIAAKLGEHWRIAYEYTDCFRMSEYGDVRPRRRWALLKEIASLFDTGIFQRQGKRYRTNRDEIGKAMATMCNRNIWGVKSHGYLVAILMKTGERISAEGLTAREERGREEGRGEMHRKHCGQGPQEDNIDFRSIIDGLGGIDER